MLEERGFSVVVFSLVGLVLCVLFVFWCFSLEMLALPGLSVTVTGKQHAGVHVAWLKIIRRKTHGISNHFPSSCGAAGGSSPGVSDR